ncbi:MAG: GNAT family N-acetyltransferase [Acetatifactor sp.]|nr:GNAT family N-acetyltransferase [Acetatifactor sp.]
MCDRMETERLLVRRVCAEDWKGLQSIWAEVAKTIYAQYDHPQDTSDENVKQRVERWASMAESMEHIFYVVCLKETVIGYVALNVRENGHEIGYCFHPDYYGKGYATESIIKILYALKERGISRIEAGTALNNIHSVRLLQRLGFKQVRTEKVSFYKDEDGNDIVFEGGVYDYEF